MSTSTFSLSEDRCLQHQITTTTTSPANHKPTLVFLHYWGGSIRTWRKVIANLHGTYPTVAINLPGWSGSTLPDQDTNTRHLTINSQALSVFNLLLSLPQNLLSNGVVLIGHSMGAKISISIATIVEQDRSLSLEGMVLVAPAPPTSLQLPTEMREQQIHAYDSEESVEFVLTNVLSTRDMLTVEDLTFAIQDSLAGSKLAKEAWPSSGMNEEVTLSSGKGMKTVVIASENDMVEPKERVLNEVVSPLKKHDFDVDFRIVRGGKHLIPLENPDAIVDAVIQNF